MKRFVIILALLVGLGCFTAFFLTGEAASEDNFNKVAEGMTQAEVRELLGEPDDTWGGSPDRTTYYYGGFRRLRWCTMEVFFDENGRVVSKFHDH
ncbi:outer membrane protein assembly factor BamE domain-containing protein [Sulfuriroseicoccus oceanibius]|uniref:Outer membrane protein assembly factor BamE n=1 Tax=Sulfuriroseicoccus oceanibius TaxID=2707525 RepID=A0A6B3LED2_9BACT|nr:outer membrane protein assembly factor BamE [Sulfuriroseicoccus oceanibius]QQL44075.1 outer membrane protein assembly factor BamE [Sulfuriroseicoccus oceanibius]